MRGLVLLCGLPALAFAYFGQKPPAATYSRDIRPIIEKKCVACHSEGGLGPFSLQTFEQTRKRGDLVRQVVLTGQMPPTDAASDFEALSPYVKLTPEELRVVQEWFRLGMPEGAKTEPLPGRMPVQMSLSETSITMPTTRRDPIPAEGRSARIVYPLGPEAEKTAYLSRFEFHPDARKAIRQVVLAIQKPGKPEPFTSSGLVPGTPAMAWSQGFNPWRSVPGAIKVEKGDRIWLQLKAVPTGKVERASGMVTLDHGVEREIVMAKTLGHREINVAPDAQVTLRSEWVLDQDIDLISAIPEARFTTEQVRLIATFEGQTKALFSVLTWDPIWPGAYNFRTPIRLKRGTTLAYEAYINNSKHGHAAEEEKPKTLRFGPNPQDELFWCHLTYIPR